jgi:hypothetical protein
LKAVLHILNTEGISGQSTFFNFVKTFGFPALTSIGLYAGLLPKLIQSVLTAAFMFVMQRRIYSAVKTVSLLSRGRAEAADADSRHCWSLLQRGL